VARCLDLLFTTRISDMKVASTTLSHVIAIGIDTARYGHHLTFLRDDRQPAAKPLQITENRQGYQQLQERLQELFQRHPEAEFRVHIDAAGQYATNLEQFLRELKLPLAISVGEPKRNKDYHKALFPKQTTDATESKAMARFALAEQPPPAASVPEAWQLLREVASRLQGAVKDTTRATNRLHNLLARVFPELPMKVKKIGAGWVLKMLRKYPTPQGLASASANDLKQVPHLKAKLAEELQAAAKTSVGSLKGDIAEVLIRQQVQQLKTCQQSVKSLKKLLEQAFQALPRSAHVQVQTIPGIGTMTAAVLVAKMISIERFATPENLVGYFGIFPELNTSGVDRSGKPVPPGTMQMSAKGADLVRRYLWNAAKSAMRCNPAVRELYARLRARGARGDVALGHCMRKLLHQVFAVWVSDQPYREAASLPRHTQPAAAATTTDPSPSPETTTAAGHKRKVNPQGKVVTAANSNVARHDEPVKQSVPSRGSIDYAYLREQINLEQVLRHLGYLDRLRGSSVQRTGPCPFHQAKGKGSRSFSVNLKKHVFRCGDPTCQAQGNTLDLWALAHELPLYEAALHLADTFHLQTHRTREEATRNRVPVKC
jgi:transposase